MKVKLIDKIATLGNYAFFCSMSNLKVSLVQTTLHWENKALNLSMLADKIASVKVYEQDKPLKKIPIEITASVAGK